MPDNEQPKSITIGRCEADFPKVGWAVDSTTKVLRLDPCDCPPLAPVRYVLKFAGIETEVTPTFGPDGELTGWTGTFGPIDENQAEAVIGMSRFLHVGH